MNQVKKVALAYSGGLDTSVIIPWLKENYGCEVVAVAVDVGQAEETSGLAEKAYRTGACDFHLIDAREEFAKDYIFPVLKAGAIYEKDYLLGTATARPLIARKQVEIALATGCDAVAHGCTGKGNDQVRFELAYAALAPVIVTATSVTLGWRAAFVVTGSLGSLWIVGWLWYTRKFSSQLGGSTFCLRDIFRVMVGIVCRRNFWMLAFAAILVNGVSFFLADWIPLYLKTERGFSFAAGNALSMVVYGGLEVGNITVGLFVRKLITLGLSGQSAKNRTLFVSCVLMSFGTIVGLTSSAFVAIACLLSVAIGVASFLVIYHTLVQDLEPSYVGTSSGLLGGLGNMAYGYLSPHIGRLSDLNESASTFLLVGLLPWLAFFAISRGMKAQTG
jgi:hypothetical protein